LSGSKEDVGIVEKEKVIGWIKRGSGECGEGKVT
jgi:hypothetical protein